MVLLPSFPLLVIRSEMPPNRTSRSSPDSTNQSMTADHSSTVNGPHSPVTGRDDITPFFHLLTFHGTLLCAQADTGRMYHGPADQIQLNRDAVRCRFMH